jgi:hypothetical protein
MLVRATGESLPSQLVTEWWASHQCWVFPSIARPIERATSARLSALLLAWSNKDVDTPVQTGLKASFDDPSRTWLGPGVVTVRQKTALALDTIINQKEDLYCIYVAIGKKATVARTVAMLERYGQWIIRRWSLPQQMSLLLYNTCSVFWMCHR